MARRRSKSLTGRVFREATRTLPGPIQFALATPFRAFVTLCILGAAMSYGLVTVQWQNGRPNIQVDQQRAAELKEKGIDWVQQQEGGLQDRLWGGDDHAPTTHPAIQSPFGTPATPDRTTPFSTATTPRKGRVGIRRD